MKTIIIAYSVIAAFCFCSCASGAGRGNNHVGAENTGGRNILELTDKDNDSEMQVNIGEKVELVLISQAGTGYEWHIESLDQEMLRLIDKKSEYRGERNRVGGEVVNTWYFETLRPGDTELVMMYYRGWEGKSRALRSFNVKLHVVRR